MFSYLNKKQKVNKAIMLKMFNELEILLYCNSNAYEKYIDLIVRLIGICLAKSRCNY